MDAAAGWRARGANVVPLVAGRPFGVLLGWEVRHPFRLRPSYEAVDHLPGAERVERLRERELRDQILSEQPVTEDPTQIFTQAALTGLLPFCYVLRGDDPDYEQPAAQSLMALAERSGTSVEAAAYDALASGDGSTMLLLPLFNYADANHDALYEQMQDPTAILGLADGGAHCGAICDASMPTSRLTHPAPAPTPAPPPPPPAPVPPP